MTNYIQILHISKLLLSFVFAILKIFLKSWTENELTNRIDQLLKLKPISIIVNTRLQ